MYIMCTNAVGVRVDDGLGEGNRGVEIGDREVVCQAGGNVWAKNRRRGEGMGDRERENGR